MIVTVSNDRLVINTKPVRFVATPHQGGRIEPHLIVLHDTAGRLDPPGSSVAWFQDPRAKASAHLVIERDGSVVQLVEFDRAAYHAGKSSWRGRANCNAFAIGIEIASPGLLTRRGDRCFAWFGESWPVSDCVEAVSAAHGGKGWWLPYTAAQITAVERIVRALAIHYDTITDVAGHFEISPRRKVDVGPHYPLDRVRAILADRHAPDPGAVQEAQDRLAELGYFPGASDGTLGPRTRAAIRAFQEQNRLDVTGSLDDMTRDTLASDTAKEMPTASRATETKADLRAEGSETMTSAAATKRGAELGAMVETATAAGQVLDQIEQAKATSERAFSILYWLMTPGGIKTALTLAILAGIWLYADRIEWARWRDHVLGRNAGGRK